MNEHHHISHIRRSQPLIALIQRLITLFGHIPDSLIAAVGRFSIAAVFWKSGQTKIQGLAIDLISGEFTLGWPHLSDSATELFRSEYHLPWIAPELAAPMAAMAEHVFPVLLLLGLATRFSALALFGMTMVIEIFVYPDAYPVHGTWAAILLYLMAKGPGKISVDHWIARCVQR
ncbi:DoxX family protein [Undibacterium griseum]|uniref:DoxX family protein n=1 Tax=Undibacterium griseum TaxID=2762295 RepID=A0ABR6YJ11_9BURK|nr:DoxX family protein [Undibacterium griseum]MBC3883813.1 DoxX family protein [Undibacterium griseum]